MFSDIVYLSDESLDLFAVLDLEGDGLVAQQVYKLLK